MSFIVSHHPLEFGSVIIRKPLNVVLKSFVLALLVFAQLLTPSWAESEGLPPFEEAANLAISEAKPIPLVIGVLALNSEEEVLTQWIPLAEYLNAHLPNLYFRIKPLDFDEIELAVKKADVDFLIANPAFYIVTQQKYGTQALATLVRELGNAEISQFGGVVFSRLGVDVEDTVKLHQEDVAAVAPYSLGGYLVQRKLFKDQFKISLNDRRVTFYNSHRDVVNAVISGEKKVGFVRTGILETSEGSDLLEVFKTPLTPEYSLKLSTRLYPEWPFAALKHVPRSQSEAVLEQLFHWQYALNKNSFSRFEESVTWGLIHSYEPISDLLKQFRVAPYNEIPRLRFSDWISQYKEWAIFFVAILLGLLMLTGLLNRKQSLVAIQKKNLNLEVEKKEEVIKQLELANNSLKFQQERFQVLSDASHDGVIIFSLSGHIEYINPFALKFWGKEHSVIERLNAYHLFSDVDDRKHIHHIMDTLGEVIESPLFLEEFTPEVVSADGSLKKVKMRLNAVHYGGKWLLVVNFNDLSEQKHLEKAYYQALFLAQVYIDVSGQVIFTFDEAFNLLNVNSQACELFLKQSGKAFCGSRNQSRSENQDQLPLMNIGDQKIYWLEWISEQQRADLSLQLREMLRDDRPSEYVFNVPPDEEGVFNGFQLHFNYVVNRMLDDAFFMCVAHDISDIQQAQKELYLSQENFNSVVKQNHTGILILDEAGVIRFINPVVEQLMGLCEEELLGMHFGIPLGLDETIRHEFDIVTAEGATGVAELAYTETEWMGEKAYLVLMYDVTDLKAAQREVDYQALHDVLTGLPNRGLFIQHLDNAIESSKLSKTPFAVLFMDLDRFKVINDTLGYQVGDELLTQITERIQQVLRSSDLLARMGGDEFTLLLPGVDSDSMLQAISEKILAQLTQKFMVQGYELSIGASMGGVIYPNFGHNSIELLKMADMAMYHAKISPNLKLAIFHEELMSSSTNAFSLESELNHAVVQQEFILFYQPQFDGRSLELTGMEALLRWKHPQRGLLSPDLFIPVLETTGKIVEIGTWVLDEVLKKIQQWQLQNRDIRIAINVSSIQFDNNDFAKILQEKFLHYKVDPRNLTIEITESTLMHNPHNTLLQLQKIHAMGVEIHMDDFGTGYSSLARLKQLPFDVIKIDKGFVQALSDDSKDQVMLRAITETIHAFGMEVIAEGVETDMQREALIEIGCWNHQGYFYEKPLEESEIYNRCLKPLRISKDTED